MFSLYYPNVPFRLKEEDGKRYVFDEIRKAWLVITPEEWVRQHFIQYLVHVKKYPLSFIAVEKRLKLNELSKRFDILIYDSQHTPWMMVECKAMHIPLNEEVLHQILRYNQSIPVPYLVITNGGSCAVLDRSSLNVVYLDDLPSWN